MRLSAHITQVNVAGVVTQTGRIAQLLGVLLLVPAAVALGYGEHRQAGAFVGVAAILIVIGQVAARRRRHDIGFTDGLVITALAYLVASLAGAVALLPTAPIEDALFEAMSGFTTTGLTVIPIQDMPRSVAFFRAFAQWIGGAGIVVLTLAILLRTNRPAHRLYVSEADEQQLLGSVRTTAVAVAKVYLGLTTAAVLAFAVVGMGWFDAVTHAMATVSTGGFSPHADSMAWYPETLIRVVVMITMLAGATSFPLLARARSEGFSGFARDPQVRALAVTVVLATGLMWLASDASSAGEAAFHAVTSLTTTGFSVTDPGGWSAATRSMAVVLMIIGGSAGSTAGGIKLIRLILLLRLGGWLLARTLLPGEAKLPVRRGRMVVSETELLTMTAFVVMYLAVLTVSTVALTFTGASMGDAVFEATSALGTVGLSVGVTSSDLPVWAKLLLTADMWLGRLEIVPVVVLLYPGVWRE